MPRTNDLLCPPAGKDDPYGLEEDLYIAPQAPVINILNVQFDNVLKILNIAAAADLPQAGDARFHGKAALVVAFVLFILVQRGRAGA